MNRKHHVKHVFHVCLLLAACAAPEDQTTDTAIQPRPLPEKLASDMRSAGATDAQMEEFEKAYGLVTAGSSDGSAQVQKSMDLLLCGGLRAGAIAEIGGAYCRSTRLGGARGISSLGIGFNGSVVGRVFGLLYENSSAMTHQSYLGAGGGAAAWWAGAEGYAFKCLGSCGGALLVGWTPGAGLSAEVVLMILHKWGHGKEPTEKEFLEQARSDEERRRLEALKEDVLSANDQRSTDSSEAQPTTP